MQMFMTEFGQEVMQCIRRGSAGGSCNTENWGTFEYKGVRIKWVPMLEVSGLGSLSDPRFEVNAVIAGCSDNAQSYTKDSALWSAWKEGKHARGIAALGHDVQCCFCGAHHGQMSYSSFHGMRFMRYFQSCLVGKKQRSRRVPVKYNFQLIFDAAKVMATENGVS